MLRRIDITDPWRSLDRDFWPEDLPFGRKTVVYGHNGSGKSTLAELLLSLSEGEGATGAVWEDENRHPTRTSAGGAPPSLSMAVFTRRWVKANLSAFLDGKSASAIVTLGKEAIDAKDEEARLVAKIAQLHDERRKAEAQHKLATSEINKLVRDVQERIVSQLKEFDYNYYTKNRFSVSRVQSDLRNHKGDRPNSDAHAEALRRLAEGAPASLPNITPPPTGVAGHLAILSELLAMSPTRMAIEALNANSSAQTWVEQGLTLHKELDRCLFCDGEISNHRRNQLALHFDESWLKIRGQAQALLTAVTTEKEALHAWKSGLPDAARVTSTLQVDYQGAIEQVQRAVDERVTALEAVESALKAKVANPSATPLAPEWSVLASAPSTAAIDQVVTEQNDEAARYADVTARYKQTVLDHLVGSQSDAFRRLEEQAGGLATIRENTVKAADLAERRLSEVRQAQFTTKDMANTLTKDLARVYGKGHLTVAVTPDGKSYACRRGNKPSTDLSDGERMTLSLLYFLRKLQDEQAPGGHPSQRIVVVDDPSSSLDREAVFATHQWLIDSLKNYGQYVILTHDFSLLRLFLKSHKNAWGKSMKEIREGNTEEKNFPRVSFLEMYATSVNGERRSKVGELPRVLLNSTSEYAYLFSMVMAGIADPEDHERLFLLPNAARRVLEVFASYKAPHRSDFLQQLETLVNSQEGEPYRDVYDFCNRYSHGEGNESIDVLDARAVSRQIRRCMEFLRSVDSEHFDRMCKATNLEPTILP